MGSRFPGIDPYLESQRWRDFHTTFNAVLRKHLLERLDARYYVELEMRVYSELSISEVEIDIVPDLTVHSDRYRQSSPSIVATKSRSASVPCRVPLPVEQRERYLLIADAQSRTAVTIIETLSPFNKQPGRRGYGIYRRKRAAIMQSTTHFVELDLLRGGRRLPVEGLPASGFYALVSRHGSRPAAEGYPWLLPDSLPRIDIPLLPEDDDLTISLQEVYARAFDFGEYDRSLDYRERLRPPLSEEDATWMAGLKLERE